MKNLSQIKLEIAEMSHIALNMLKLTHQAFMEHEVDLIAQALKEEDKLNRMDDEITEELIEYGHGCVRKDERAKVAIYVDLAADLELIGDYCKDILERVQIKIEEKLLFSEEAVVEYNDLYAATESALTEVSGALEKNDLNLVSEVLKKQEHIDSLVDELRKRHNQRLIEKACSAMGCNMYLNMLDFTAAIYYHAKKIARNLLKIKNG
jgi:phosphate:Na+ symporter